MASHGLCPGHLIFTLINPFNEVCLPQFSHFNHFPSKPDALAVLEVILIMEVLVSSEPQHGCNLNNSIDLYLA